MTSPTVEGTVRAVPSRASGDASHDRRSSLHWRRIDPAIVALTALALAVAFYRLGTKSLWLDEAVSVSHARLGWSGLWRVVSGGDPNMAPYYVLLHVWVRLFGYTDASVRIMGVLLGVWSVPAVAILGTRLFGRASGLAAGLLLALAPFFVHYEQTVRAYGLVVALVALSSYFFVREFESPSRATRLGYVLTSALAIYAHYLASFVVGMQALTLLVVKRRAAFTWGWLTAGAGIAVLCIPAAVFAARAGPGQIAWIPKPSLHTLIQLPGQLAGGTALACVLIALACYGVGHLWADRRRWQAGLLVACCMGPILLDFAVSRAGRPLFLSYYLIVALPALLLLAAAGLMRLPGAPTRLAVLGGVVALSALGLANWYRQPSVENWRAATRFVLRHERPGDALFFDPVWASIPFGHYETLAHTPVPSALKSLPTARGPTRIWLVFRDSDVPPVEQIQVEQRIAHGYQDSGRDTAFTNVTIALYRAR